MLQKYPLTHINNVGKIERYNRNEYILFLSIYDNFMSVSLINQPMNIAKKGANQLKL